MDNRPSGVFRKCFEIFWQQKDHFLRLAIIPGIGQYLLSIPLSEGIEAILSAPEADRAQAMAANAGLVLGPSMLYLALLAIFVTNFLRHLAFGAKGTDFFGVRIGRAHIRIIFAGFIVLIFQSVLMSLAIETLGRFLPLLMVGLLSLTIGAYFFLRLTPFFIGVAIERPIPIKKAWEMTRQVIGQIFLTIIVLEFFVLALEQGVAILFYAGGLMTAAPHAGYLLLSFLELVRTALVTIAVFLFFRKMTDIKAVT